MRLIWLAIVLVGVAVLGCSDGKLNLMLVIWADHESEPSSASPYVPPSSSSVEPPSSSSIYYPSSSEEPLSSSSSEEEPPSSSSEEPPSSSSEEPPPVSSSRGERPERSSGSKTNKDGEEFIDYPTLDLDQPDVFHGNPGGITRYWDSCRPSCANPEHLGAPNFPKPNGNTLYGIAKSCDKNGNEMPVFYRDQPLLETPTTHAFYQDVPNGCQQQMMTTRWPQSVEYKEWVAQNPDFPTDEPRSFVCLDQFPYAVNDTLAYAFTASGQCGKCYQLQFTGEFHYDGNGPRAPHRALKGKTLIVMNNNHGVEDGSFDIMIPGGGVGNYPEGISIHSGVPREFLGESSGGLLATVWQQDQGGMPERYTLEQTQEFLRKRCKAAFDRPNVNPAWLRGCLWHADWLMAADNPEALYKEVECPKYLVDRYGSSFPLPKRPETLLPTANCTMLGGWQCDP